MAGVKDQIVDPSEYDDVVDPNDYEDVTPPATSTPEVGLGKRLAEAARTGYQEYLKPAAQAVVAGRKELFQAIPPAIGGVVGGIAGAPAGPITSAFGAAQGMAMGRQFNEWMFPELRAKSLAENIKRRAGEVVLDTATGAAFVGGARGAEIAEQAIKATPGVILRGVQSGSRAITEKLAEKFPTALESVAAKAGQGGKGGMLAAAERGAIKTEVPLSAGERGAPAGEMFQRAEETLMPREAALRREISEGATKSELEKILPDESIMSGRQFNAAWKEADVSIQEKYKEAFGAIKEHVVGDPNVAAQALPVKMADVMKRHGGITEAVTAGSKIDLARVESGQSVGPQLTEIAKISGDPVARAHQFLDAIRTGRNEIVDVELGIAIPTGKTPLDAYDMVSKTRQAIARRMGREGDEAAKRIYRDAYGEARNIQKSMLDEAGVKKMDEVYADYTNFSRLSTKANMFSDEALPEPDKIANLLKYPERLRAAHEILIKGGRPDAAQNIGSAALKDVVGEKIAKGDTGIYKSLKSMIETIPSETRAAAFNQKQAQDTLDLAAYWDLVQKTSRGDAESLMSRFIRFGGSAARLIGGRQIVAGARGTFVPKDIGAAVAQSSKVIGQADLPNETKERLLALMGVMAEALVQPPSRNNLQ